MARLPALRRLLSVAAVAALLSLGTASPAPTSCNGSPALCGRRYSEVSFVGSHDSPFVGVEIGTNQFESVTKQLDLGVRFLQSQAHMYKGALKMCHTSCLLKDSGTVQKYLEDVKRWMDAHPNEVVTLLITNPRGAKVQDFANAFAAAKMDGMAFVPREKTLKLDQWPTLGELISSGKRLVVFLDYGSDQAAVPWILDEWNYYFETPFGVTDPNFGDCSMDRPPNASPDGRMYLVNHFLNIELFKDVVPGIKVPHMLQAWKTNSVESIFSQINLCKSKWGRQPQVVLLDWISVPAGQPMRAQNMLNGLA